MARKRTHRGLPGRRLDRVVNAGPRVEASSALAVATPPPRTAPWRPPQPQPIRDAVAGPQFQHAQLYGPKHRAHKKVYATIAAYADAGIDDPAVREITHRVKLRAPDVLAIVRELEEQRWITVQWAPRPQLRNRYVIHNPPAK
jgi:hypothetical protein